MTKQELQDALEYTKAKHKDDKLSTGDTCITILCEDTLRVLNRCIEIPANATIGDMLTAIFPNLREIEMVLENEDGEDFQVNYDLTQDVSKGWNAPYKGSEE